MKHKKSGKKYVIVLTKGEKIIESLTKFCAEEKIKAGHFHGIGGLDRAELAYYDDNDRKYHSLVFAEPPYEIVSLNGNVSLADGNIRIHAHIVLTDHEFRASGGHLNEASVSPMCEIIFVPLEAELVRSKDETTGLYMLNL